MLLPALLTGLMLAQSPTVQARKERGVDGLAVPLLSYNSDQGWGYGGVGGAYIYSPGYRPYRHAVSAQTFFTTFGIQNHFLRYDGPRLLGPVRVEARLEYRRELVSPYLGAGNLSAPGVRGDQQDRGYGWDRSAPGGWVRGRFRPAGDDSPFELYGGYGYRSTRVRTYEGSLLLAERPRGLEGGPTGQVMLGAVWDTRDDESDPTRGQMTEVGARLADRVTGSGYRYGGLTASTRHYFRLGPRFVLAQRVMADHLFGDVPFFEWSTVGGLVGAEGLGGMSTLRGVPRNRYVGNTKVMSNTELRVQAFQFPLLGEPLRVSGLVLFDAGRLWHPGTDDGAWYRIHTGVGAGVRLARRAAVLRLDYALAPEMLRQGVYVSFGHMF
ncbi:MAG TPA: BamA/TamA family outer membrane protein [Myxococcaceae bacterium]|nr:BamA/TamA family outer membrane protein [Myxococcaceae bacterium]